MIGYDRTVTMRSIRDGGNGRRVLIGLDGKGLEALVRARASPNVHTVAF